MDKVVIIEDEKDVGETLKFILERDAFKVDLYQSAEEFFLAKHSPPTCVYIIDSNLPGMSGEEIIKTIRSKDMISPIFIISGKSEGEDISYGLESGADDYLPKPFNTEHLLRKIKNSVQKTNSILGNLINVGIKLIPEANSLIMDGSTIPLTSREFAIVHSLLDRPGRIVSREELVQKFDDPEVTTRTIDVHVSSLRRKLDKVRLTIETVRGQGYKILT